jgi:50S ribosomal protein L16 3-hydroxylase
VLEPGDMLYLPPGVPHHGVAVDACLTFSVGMRAPAHSELLSEWADDLLQRLPEERRYVDAGLAAPKDANEIGADAADRVLAIFDAHVPKSRVDAAAFLGRFITGYRNAVDIAPPPKPPTARKVDEQLAKGALLNPHPFARWAWSGDLLHVQGESFAVGATGASRLAQARPLDAAAVAGLDAATRAVLGHLVERGYLVLGPAPRKR